MRQIMVDQINARLLCALSNEVKIFVPSYSITTLLRSSNNPLGALDRNPVNAIMAVSGADEPYSECGSIMGMCEDTRRSVSGIP